ncbi:MAG: molybdenum cofactor synthesis domain-containing protein [bacterium]
MSTKNQNTTGRVVSINSSIEKGATKSPREQVEVNNLGIIGDAHAGLWHRQVSLLGLEDIQAFSAAEAQGRTYKPGDFAENITTQGIDYRTVCVLDRFTIGEVELEITQIGKKCHGSGCAIFVEVGACVMPKSGIFARVVQGGKITKGDSIVYHPRLLKIAIITLSDRASSGVYEDRSGPKIKEILAPSLSERRWHLEFSSLLIPDDKDALLSALEKSVQENVDIIFTTGGTGIGPRDITPDVVEEFADKLIPGVMEYIRVKYGETIPSALLSRSLAAVKNQTLIYCLPGSVKAVSDYTTEILRTLEHAILMIHNIGH